jgi:hypothetical protein
MTTPEVLMILKQGIRFEAPSAAERREPFAVVRCPGCKGAGTVDSDQYEGQTSIDCSNPDCTYHETHDLRKAPA